MATPRILIVGGNGFIGSAVCKAALARGMQVTSVSSSGKPYHTPKGHTPAWTSNVDWQQGDALQPESFEHLFPKVDGVVHTLGTLLENDSYKHAVREGNIPNLIRGLFQSFTGDSSNPLQKKAASTSYETMNRDSALRVCAAFVASPGRTDMSDGRPFIFVSAEDIFRPVIPARYIETKWEAERGIQQMMKGNSNYRGVYIRPSLVYHAHLRPLTTPAATLLDLSAAIHKRVPRSIPTPSSLLRSLGSIYPTPAASASSLVSVSPLESMANMLSIPPIHVDHVAEAICVAFESQDVRGIVGVRRMRELIGWPVDGGVDLAV